MQEANERKGMQAARQWQHSGIGCESIPELRLGNLDVFSNMVGKVAVVTGGDSVAGRELAVLFAREGANVVVAYLDQHKDAEETKRKVEGAGKQCLLIPGDVRDETHCAEIIEAAVARFGGIDILVNDELGRCTHENLEDITIDESEKMFRTDLLNSLFRKLF